MSLMAKIRKPIMSHSTASGLYGLRRGLFFVAVLISLIAPGILYAQSGGDLGGLDGEATFFSSLEDIPLMPGLSELPAQGMVFDKPEGRIVEALALTGGIPHQDILVYYGGTLPQLGWGRVNDSRFFREGEVLEISFSRLAEGDVVRIMVRPVL